MLSPATAGVVPLAPRRAETGGPMFTRSTEVWTDERQGYLIRHALDGVGLLSHALGISEDEVVRQAERSGLRLSYGPQWGELELCPVCCARYVRPRTTAYRAGVCPVCWDRMKAEAMRERAATVNARRDYEAAKKQAQRTQGSE